MNKKHGSIKIYAYNISSYYDLSNAWINIWDEWRTIVTQPNFRKLTTSYDTNILVYNLIKKTYEFTNSYLLGQFEENLVATLIYITYCDTTKSNVWVYKFESNHVILMGPINKYS